MGQLWPNCRLSALFNDIAIAALVLDVFLAMIGWPSGEVRAGEAEHAAAIPLHGKSC
jgi:hypothetical protein